MNTLLVLVIILCFCMLTTESFKVDRVTYSDHIAPVGLTDTIQDTRY